MARLTSLFAEWARRARNFISKVPTRKQQRASQPFADRVDGAYLPSEWLEPYCAELGLPLAEIEGGWDISDGEDVYFCPRVMLADDPDSPDDTRAFARVDAVRRWPEPR